jgi:TolB protein
MPQLSPDGRRVAFASDRSGDWEIWVSDIYGTNPLQLTFMNAIATGYPHWSPDGERIVFHSNVEGQWDVFFDFLQRRQVLKISLQIPRATPSPVFRGTAGGFTSTRPERENFGYGRCRRRAAVQCQC